MTDTDREAEIREAEIREACRRIVARFMALDPSEGAGNVTIHYAGRRPRKVEWKTLDDVGQWVVDVETTTEGR